VLQSIIPTLLLLLLNLLAQPTSHLGHLEFLGQRNEVANPKATLIVFSNAKLV
jgi:hypothetical protein